MLRENKLSWSLAAACMHGERWSEDGHDYMSLKGLHSYSKVICYIVSSATLQHHANKP